MRHSLQGTVQQNYECIMAAISDLIARKKKKEKKKSK